jgi:predicted MFS family arabinose efflux permease
MVMMCSLQIQYFSIYFLGASIGGNKFVNLMLIGVGEMIGGALSGFALTRMSDHRVFQIVTLVSSSMNLVFYAVPEGLPSYTCFILFIMGIAGQFNAILIIVELRVPPENTGAAFQILFTVGTMAATLSPMIASAG